MAGSLLPNTFALAAVRLADGQSLREQDERPRRATPRRSNAVYPAPSFLRTSGRPRTVRWPPLNGRSVGSVRCGSIACRAAGNGLLLLALPLFLGLRQLCTLRQVLQGLSSLRHCEPQRLPGGYRHSRVGSHPSCQIRLHNLRDAHAAITST